MATKQTGWAPGNELPYVWLRIGISRAFVGEIIKAFSTGIKVGGKNTTFDKGHWVF